MEEKQQVLEVRHAELVMRRDALITEADAVETEVSSLRARCAAELEQLDAAVIFEETSEQDAEKRRAAIRAELAAADERAERAQRARHALPEFERRITTVQAELAQVRRDNVQERAAVALRDRNEAAVAFGVSPSLATRAELQTKREQAADALARFTEAGGDATSAGPLSGILDEPDFRTPDVEEIASSFEELASALRAGPLTPVADASAKAEAVASRKRNEERQMVATALSNIDAGSGLDDLKQMFPPHIVAMALKLHQARRAEMRERVAASEERDGGFPRVVRAA